MMLQSRPLIGVTADRNKPSIDPESNYFVRRNYCSAIQQAGGVPLILPYDIEGVEQLIGLLDGLVITGGMFDIAPSLYGGPRLDGIVLKSDRTAFELMLLQQGLVQDMPILGICGGMQLIGVALGSSLFQDLPAERPDGMEHMQSHSCTQAQHKILIEPDSILFRALGRSSLEINSLHHQALKDVVAPLRITAWSEDGVVEAIESSNHSFCIGTQWHPEYGVDQRESMIFKSLVDAARKKVSPN